MIQTPAHSELDRFVNPFPLGICQHALSWLTALAHRHLCRVDGDVVREFGGALECCVRRDCVMCVGR